MEIDAYPLEIVLGSNFSATIRIVGASGAGVDLTGCAIDVVITDVEGRLYARLAAAIAPQTSNPGLINLSASPIAPAVPVSIGTYRRNMPKNCVYAITIQFPQGLKFPFPPQSVTALQTPQNLLVLQS
jgi:hypothetical protein